MKRDMDLIRDILLWLEARPAQTDEFVQLGGEGGDYRDPSYSDAEIEMHATLMIEAGLLKGPNQQSDDGVWIISISWAGHDFLEAVRDRKIWERTKQGAGAAGGFTIELLQDLAKGFIRKQVEERTGIKL
jgi:hypothetical protein